MAGVTVVCFDVGETLADEAAAKARWESLGVADAFGPEDLHADVRPCLAALRMRGLRLGAAGNMRAVHEDFLRGLVDFVGSSESWGVEKPDAGFFRRVVEEAGVAAEQIAYVGDRVDNDLLPAHAAGMTAVRIRRGAHAADETPPGFPEIESLVDLPDVLW
jgi:FMN phosphatase YigB (HAD superfamily)